MLDEPDDHDLATTNRSPELHGTYPSQFDHSQPQQHGDYYQLRQGMQPGQQQHVAQQGQFEQPQMMPPTSHSGDGQFDVDPSDPMLDADPFGLSASMHYPASYHS